jgi:hypothetical protein
MKNLPNLNGLLAQLDLTQLFKEAGTGNRRKWSAKRTFSGAVVAVALYDVQVNGLTWMAVAMCAVAALPLTASVWQRPGKDVDSGAEPSAQDLV